MNTNLNETSDKYLSDTFPSPKEIQRKIQTFVNRCVRYTYIKNMVAKYYFQQRPTESNRTIRYKCRNKKRKFRWIGHTLRKEDGETPKAALLWNPQGNKKRGRPRNRWRRSVIKEAGRSWNELRFLAADRQKWKGLIDNLCS